MTCPHCGSVVQDDGCEVCDAIEEFEMELLNDDALSDDDKQKVIDLPDVDWTAP